jgi:hypothetical protein
MKYKKSEQETGRRRGEGEKGERSLHVGDERALLQELLAADGAGVRHLAVHAAVVHELELARERRAALRAHERRQRPVEPAVHHQVLLRTRHSLLSIFSML